ncbi:MAG: hypothetical protein K8J08_20990, partial [Thermoanaerobaculia bacterium]|nr:hypothetical protein [Thermoanaerobaculia bacterium]
TPAVPMSRSSDPASIAPVLPSGINSRYVVRRETTTPRRYEPFLLGEVSVRFEDRASGTRSKKELRFLAEVPSLGQLAEWLPMDDDLMAEVIVEEAPVPAPHDDLDPTAAQSKSYTVWKKELTDHVYHEHRLTLWRSATLDETSRPGEDERAFRIRLGDIARERREVEKSKLQEHYDKELARLEAREAKAQQKVEVQKEQLSSQKMQTAISFGTTLLSALVGRKRLSRSAISGAGQAMRGMGRSNREAGDVERAKAELQSVLENRQELEVQLGRDLLATSERYRPDREKLETVDVAPLKKNIRPQSVDLLWVGR